MDGSKSSIEESLSARRAWIEIDKSTPEEAKRWKSLSARRAWIEIAHGANREGPNAVALRKESVDRNTLPKNPMIRIDSRSPQGERG